MNENSWNVMNVVASDLWFAMHWLAACKEFRNVLWKSGKFWFCSIASPCINIQIIQSETWSSLFFYCLQVLCYYGRRITLESCADNCIYVPKTMILKWTINKVWEKEIPLKQKTLRSRTSFVLYDLLPQFFFPTIYNVFKLSSFPLSSPNFDPDLSSK